MRILVRYKGREMTIADAVLLAGGQIGARMARKRLQEFGWTVERAVETPRRGTFEPDRQERDRLKKQRYRAERKAAKRAMLAATTFSKTSPAYRNMLGPAPEMTKSQLRAVITQAVINTQAMA